MGAMNLQQTGPLNSFMFIMIRYLCNDLRLNASKVLSPVSVTWRSCILYIYLFNSWALVSGGRRGHWQRAPSQASIQDIHLQTSVFCVSESYFHRHQFSTQIESDSSCALRFHSSGDWPPFPRPSLSLSLSLSLSFSSSLSSSPSVCFFVIFWAP